MFEYKQAEERESLQKCIEDSIKTANSPFDKIAEYLIELGITEEIY